MATQNIVTTTLMGKTYNGRPYGLALALLNYELDGKPEEAVALLNSHNSIRHAFGQPDYDLAKDFSTMPMEGWLVARVA